MSRRSTSVYHARLNVKKHHLSFLIGKGGVTIKCLQREHNIRSHINQKELVYYLSGEKNSVDAAAAAITKHIRWIDNLPVFAAKKKKVSRKNRPDADGWTVAGAAPAKPKLEESTPVVLKNDNKYAGFESDTDDDEPEEKPKKRVTFAHDATGEDEIREFDKDEPASYVSNSSGEDEPSDEDIAYLASKRTSATAWRPRSRSQSPAADSNSGNTFITALRDHVVNGADKPQRKAVKKSWADIADECESDSDGDDLFLGSY